MDMAAEHEQETLESWLNKATDPCNLSDRWDCIKGFYEHLNKEQDGPQIATRLLAHKIQSPQEKEALQALTVLEACMNNCGTPFHKEVGKFRFLNELIKVLSPKYLGMWSTEKVKLKVTECFYSWTQWLKDEVKIQEAYHMLKKKGIVKQDPKLPREIAIPPPSPRATGSIFDDEDKTKLLDQLLKSQNPDDLQAANLLIKSTIKEEQDRMEKINRRTSAVEDVENATERLKELLKKCRKAVTSPEVKEEIKSLYERCEKMRPILFRLASDTIDDDAALAEVLQANDKLISAINLYQEQSQRKVANETDSQELFSSKAPASQKDIKTYHLIDLSALDIGQADVSPPSRSVLDSSLLSLLDEQLMSLGLNDQDLEMTSHSSESLHDKMTLSWRNTDDCSMGKTVWDRAEKNVLRTQGSTGNGSSGSKKKSSPDPSSPTSQHNWPVLQPMLPLTDIQNQPAILSESPSHDTSLSSVFVPLESIQPSSIAPIKVYDKDGVRVMLHQAKDPPAGCPDVVVMVISILSTSPIAIKNIVFQAAVPKNMTVKLQSATRSELPAYNPLLPPVAISQVLLLSNPFKAKVRLRYKLTFTHGENKTSEFGEIEGFPETDFMCD
ncbi:ADP-ribosylation factor-binding protein GGA3-like isoform X2 [Scleropages formosus]|uniref:ADP-ribosylation factor-binding protein GGA3-like n=1 Tax=Scleropages formosus TaxID=113540 RepID=A0A8C9S7S0_SCLFO|nr:ADP-ribosylation factor-binding protein GGA3-like isoform X2 [Scleropages formosus]